MVQWIWEILLLELRQTSIVDTNLFHYSKNSKSFKRFIFTSRKVGNCSAFLTAQDSSWPAHSKGYAAVISAVLSDHIRCYHAF
mmetsp:Transcript_6977/g.15053  ORF Transcript_6977/g.15053 Transcript_6977/m.15053 type:complete len:83 (+) Transcript_6977:514-762(+)